VVGAAGRPISALAEAGVALAVRALPSAAARSRYRTEFVADLHQLRPAAQVAYLAAVICLLPALRAALQEERMLDPARRRPLWRCRVFRWHDFVVRSTDDGGRFQQCRLCGTDRGPVSHHPMTTPPYYVGSAGS
jgi:hypothetical protein